MTPEEFLHQSPHAADTQAALDRVRDRLAEAPVPPLPPAPEAGQHDSCVHDEDGPDPDEMVLRPVRRR
ncbi:hypothetical protein [Nocardiopsis synnemataformans]|uniref:hypothetical protein n=1 Tax=Nocardiopsis synnemataformans TaxID=61305 RepID=UPI003EBF8722